ncbi:MAG: hypothetical protein AAGA60_31165 [Cyanobacteria bacterium P01_E01_bin.42]
MFEKPRQSYNARTRQTPPRGQNVQRETGSPKAIERVEQPTVSTGSKTGEIFQNFTRSIGEVLVDITALEVNTMIVDRITGDKFVPWQTYRSIYDINDADLRRRNIPANERSRYLSLRRKLAFEYALIASEPSSSLYDERMLELLSQSPESIPLPNPHPPEYNQLGQSEVLRVQKLLANGRFLRSLRKTGELKACLDNQKRQVERLKAVNPNRKHEELHDLMNTDMIYAQTIVQLDGDMINRYAKEILDHPQRELILQLHQQSVDSGEKQWRGLFQFFLNLVQQAVERREGGFFDFLRR